MPASCTNNIKTLRMKDRLNVTNSSPKITYFKHTISTILTQGSPLGEIINHTILLRHSRSCHKINPFKTWHPKTKGSDSPQKPNPYCISIIYRQLVVKSFSYFLTISQLEKTIFKLLNLHNGQAYLQGSAKPLSILFL